MNRSPAEVAAAGPAVLIDCASAVIQVGLLDPKGDHRWARSESESGVGLFSCLEDLRIEPSAVPSWVFCAGPGSILGVRTAAMALRTWLVLRPSSVYSYFSLALIAESGAAPDVPVIADARRDSWHVFTRAGGLRREPSAGLSGAFVTPAGFRHWSPLPADTTVVPYDLPALLPAVWKTPLLSPCPDPDAFLHEDPTYVTWTPRIHRAPET